MLFEADNMVTLRDDHATRLGETWGPKPGDGTHVFRVLGTFIYEGVPGESEAVLKRLASSRLVTLPHPRVRPGV